LSRSISPEWFDFVHVVVSSSGFSLNISREFLQGKSALNILKNKLPKCIAKTISNLQSDKEKYEKYIAEFDKNIKLAVRSTEGDVQRSFSKFLKYPTNNGNTMIGFDEYCELVPQE